MSDDDYDEEDEFFGFQHLKTRFTSKFDVKRLQGSFYKIVACEIKIQNKIY